MMEFIWGGFLIGWICGWAFIGACMYLYEEYVYWNFYKDKDDDYS